MTRSEDEISTLSRIRRTIMQMLKDRGYLVGDFEINVTKEELISKFVDNMKREELAFAKAKTNDSSDQIHVFFTAEPKVGIPIIRNYTKLIIEQNFSRAIMVVRHKLTAQSIESINKISRLLHLEVFQESELLVNIAEHVLVPDHQALTAEEKKTLLDRYNVKETQLPRIQVSDPIARYYGMKRGQVVKIIRPSETAGQYITYRFCV